MSFKPMTATLEELRANPAPKLAEDNPEVWKQDLVKRFEAKTGRKLYPAQVEQFMIDVMSYAASVVGGSVNHGAKMGRATFATDRFLDDLAANVSIARLPAQSARANVQFTLAETRTTAVVVPKGARVAAGSDLGFATEAELVIQAGDLTGVVVAVASAPGAKFNGLLPGQISDILDPVAYVASVSNTQVSAGGADVETDNRLRERIVDASEGATNGGPRQGYRKLVKDAHPDIVDAEVVRPQAGHIHLFPLMKDGVAPDAVDDTIMSFLDKETKIPMGDYVSVQKVTAQSFDVTMTVRVKPGYAAGAQVAAETKITALFTVLGAALGAQVAPSACIEAVRQVEGVVGVDGPAFAFTDLTETQFATLGALTITIVEVPNV